MPDPRILHDLLSAATVNDDRVLFRLLSRDGRLHSLSAREVRRDVDATARALLALGVERGTKLAIVAGTSYEWVLLDLAAVGIGAITVGVYPTTQPSELKSLLAYAECDAIFVQDPELARSLVLGPAGLPGPRTVVLMPAQSRVEGGDLGQVVRARSTERLGNVRGWSDFLADGAAVSAAALSGARARGLPHDVASIVFSSGTTGDPKGAVLPHAALISAARSARASIDARDGDETLLFLPLAHVFARLCVYVALLSGTVTTFSRGPDRLMDDLPVARPHWLASAPRLFEKFHAAAADRIAHSRGPDGLVLRWALAVGQARTQRVLGRRPLGFSLSIAGFFAWLFVYRRVRRRFGGRLRFAISGSAPLAAETGMFLHALGILVLEGIGMTENSSFSHVNRVEDYRFGWVGQPGPGIEHRIAEDGEVLVRGPNLMREYYRLPADTRSAIDDDGWLHTGDIGEIDERDFLRVVGRKKDLLITAGGKNVAPAPLEIRLTASPLISQALVVGDGRSYLTALIVADPDVLARREIRAGSINEAVAREIELINADLPRYRRIKRFALVPEFTVLDGLLTPTAKQRRGAIEERFRSEIEAMYRAPVDPTKLGALKPDPMEVVV